MIYMDSAKKWISVYVAFYVHLLGSGNAWKWIGLFFIGEQGNTAECRAVEGRIQETSLPLGKTSRFVPVQVISTKISRLNTLKINHIIIENIKLFTVQFYNLFLELLFRAVEALNFLIVLTYVSIF